MCYSFVDQDHVQNKKLFNQCRIPRLSYPRGHYCCRAFSSFLLSVFTKRLKQKNSCDRVEAKRQFHNGLHYYFMFKFKRVVNTLGERIRTFVKSGEVCLNVIRKFYVPHIRHIKRESYQPYQKAKFVLESLCIYSSWIPGEQKFDSLLYGYNT